MAAISDMQISWFSKNEQDNQRLFRKKSWTLDEYWWLESVHVDQDRICKLAHGGHLGYANKLIFENEQNNKSEDDQKKIARIVRILTTGACRSWICKFTHGGHLGYVVLMLRGVLCAFLGPISEGVQIIFHADRMNIDDWRAFTSIQDMRIGPWWPSWICKLADFRT